MENKNLKQEKFSVKLKKHFQKVQIPFFVAGLAITNIGILCGLGLYNIEEVVQIKWLYLSQPLFCMWWSYEICNHLYNKNYQSSYKNLLHYMYVSFFVVSNIIGYVYNLLNISYYILLPIIYSIIFLIEFTYWKLYVKKYKRIFMRDLKTFSKIAMKQNNKPNI